MPQLDKVTFFSQVTWALACYGFLYFLFSVHVGPAIGRVLKVRSKINLGGTTAENQTSSVLFKSVISRISSVSFLAPAAFLKAFNLASKTASSAAAETLSR